MRLGRSDDHDRRVNPSRVDRKPIMMPLTPQAGEKSVAGPIISSRMKSAASALHPVSRTILFLFETDLRWQWQGRGADSAANTGGLSASLRRWGTAEPHQP